MRWSLASGGYSGFTLLSSRPCATPAETRMRWGTAAEVWSPGLLVTTPLTTPPPLPAETLPVTPAAGGLSESVKLTVTLVSTSTGSPFSRYGSYFHCLTASIAAGGGKGGPPPPLTFFTSPPLLICL